MYLKILDSLINMDKVQYVNRSYDESENRYTVHISFEGAYIDNHFGTKEEADSLFDTIRIFLEAKVIS